MADLNLEGTEVLEKLAERGLVDRFMAAVDADDFSTARKLMKQAQIGPETLSRILQEMQDSAEA